MAYIGLQPLNEGRTTSITAQQFSGDDSTTVFSLNESVPNEYAIEVFVNNVRQDPFSAYTVAGTDLTFSSAPSDGTDNIYVVFQGITTETSVPPAGSLTAASFENRTLGSPASKLQTIHVSTLDGIDSFDANVVGGITATSFVSTNASSVFQGDVTVQQNLIVDGNITAAGNTIFIDAQTLYVDDPIIYIAGNNYSSDVVDIGIVGNYYDGTNPENHAGLIRDSGTKEFYIFGEYTEEISNTTTNIDIGHASFELANLHINFVKANKYTGDGTLLTNTSFNTSDDTSTDTNYYIPFTGTTSGEVISANVSTTKLFFNPSSGQLTATDFNSLSDERFKENIVTIADATQTIEQLRGVSFTWKENARASFGLIAQEVEQVVPSLVETNDNGTKTVRYLGMIAYLIESNKELSQRVAALEAKLEENQ